MTYTQNPPPPKNTPKTPPATTQNKPDKTNQDKIKELCGHLGGALYNMPADESLLDEQVQILNALFHTTLAARLDLISRDRDYEMGYLKLALQIQRQCAETLRIRKSVDYMDGLMSVSFDAQAGKRV